jgi:glycosyltransferase involved in cell wall biosynthesis
MRAKKIKVSVVITTYRRPDTLRRAILSALNQSFAELEIIVVDDNNDGDYYRNLTSKLMSKFNEKDNVKYIQHTKNLNGAAARNSAIKAANGKYITFLDDDDFFLPDRIETLVSCLEDDVKAGCVYSGYALHRNGRVVKVCKPATYDDYVLELLCQNSFFGTGSNFMCRTELVRDIGGFDEDFERHQDIEFMIRFTEKFSIVKVDEVSVVKCLDSTINVPNAEKMERVKKLFLNKFKSLIDIYSDESRSRIYRTNYVELAKIAAWNGTSMSKLARKQLNEYGDLTFGETMVIKIKKLLSGVDVVDNFRYYIASTKIYLSNKLLIDNIANTLNKISSNGKE